MKTTYTGLVGDVGGTNARFALVDEQGHIRNPKTYPAAKYTSLTEVIADYLETTVGRRCPMRANRAVSRMATIRSTDAQRHRARSGRPDRRPPMVAEEERRCARS